MTALPAAVPPTAAPPDVPAGAASRGRRSTTWRILRLELRRAHGAAVAAVVAVLCALLLLDADLTWPGRWLELTMDLRASTMAYLLPAVAAVAVWRGQRAHRCGTGELLASTPRPRRHPLVLDWLTVTVPAAAGLLATWCVAALAPSLTAEPGRVRAPGWLGGHWELLLLATVAGLAAVAAVGLALGRAVGSRLVAPVVAVLVCVPVLLAGGAGDGLGWLTPALVSTDWVSDTVPAQVSLLQIGFFVGVTVAALTAAHLARGSGASRRAAAAALVPALAFGVACAVPLTSDAGRLVTDQAALQPTCTREVPVVCVHQANRFLLDDVAARLRPLLAVVAAAGGPTAVGLERPYQMRLDLPLAAGAEAPPPDPPVVDRPVIGLNLEAGFDGRLTGSPHANWSGEDSFAAVLTNSERCRSDGGAGRPDADETWQLADEIARGLLLAEAGPLPRSRRVDPEPDPAVDAPRPQLLASPSAERRRWLTGYYRARSTCDHRAVAALVQVP